jgi:hypothetical protein
MSLVQLLSAFSPWRGTVVEPVWHSRESDSSAVGRKGSTGAYLRRPAGFAYADSLWARLPARDDARDPRSRRIIRVPEPNEKDAFRVANPLIIDTARTGAEGTSCGRGDDPTRSIDPEVSEPRRGDRPMTRGFERRQRYDRSERGRARHGRYNHSHKGHARRQRYERSDYGQYMRSKYEASTARMLAAVRSNAKRRGQR